MRLISVVSIVFGLALTFSIAEFAPALTAIQTASSADDDAVRDHEAMTNGNRGMARPSSATTLSGTNSCGPMCCGCTR